MTQKTFFSITAILFVIVAGYFALQLHSMPRMDCDATFTFECDIHKQIACGGPGGIHVRVSSYCEGGHCIGVFMIYCANPGEPGSTYAGTLNCDSGESIYCDLW